MLVYGDHSERADAAVRMGEIQDQVDRLGTQVGIPRHASLVSALVETGRLLQAVSDADFLRIGADRQTAESQALTSALMQLGRAVVRSWDGIASDEAVRPAPLPRTLPGEVELRVPEGYAFYAVYPEGYVEAARKLSLHAPPRVIGIRSIGTSLAAVVAAALHAETFITLRPGGDPFARTIALTPELARGLLEGEAHYVIVDEGPGQSGSSFGAVADWLQERGVPLDRIAFLPSHGGQVGPQASEAHRLRWEKAQRVAADLADELPLRLSGWVAELTGQVDEPLTEVSGGEWRRYVFADEDHWPPAQSMFERRKFLASVGGNRLLIKFAGVGRIGERKLAMARALHGAGLAAEPVGLAHGFLVERWVEDAGPIVGDAQDLAAVARYIGARARLFPAADGSGASLETLFAMTQRNLSLALGREAAEAVEPLRPQLARMDRRTVRVCTDNKLDQHEWLRLGEGRLIKTDAVDHHCAHDLIGCQDMSWDVAGAICEFGLDEVEARTFAATAEQAAGRHIDADLLHFHRLAYPAFRLGQAAISAGMAAGAERDRLDALVDRYGTDLGDLLLEQGPAATRQESVVG